MPEAVQMESNELLAISDRDGRLLLQVFNDGTWKVGPEDAPEAARIFAEKLGHFFKIGSPTLGEQKILKRLNALIALASRDQNENTPAPAELTARKLAEAQKEIERLHQVILDAIKNLRAEGWLSGDEIEPIQERIKRLTEALQKIAHGAVTSEKAPGFAREVLREPDEIWTR